MDVRLLTVCSSTLALLCSPAVPGHAASAVSAHMQVGLVIRDACMVQAGAVGAPVAVTCLNPSTMVRVSTQPGERVVASPGGVRGLPADGVVTVWF